MKCCHLSQLFSFIAVVVMKISWLQMAAADDRVTLTSVPPLEGLQCSVPVKITCRADRLVTVFWWINSNPTPIARYTKPISADVLPVNMTTVESLNLGWIVLLTNSVVFNSQQNNYTTTVDTTTADLLLPPLESIVTKIWCGYNSLNASLNVSLAVRDPPPSPSDALCSLSSASGQSEVSVTLFLAQFMGEHAVSHYRVGVVPAIPAHTGCAGDFSSNTYQCDGLLVGTSYSLSIKGFNYENQEGDPDSFIVHPQVPGTPSVLSVLALYANASKLTNVNISWTQQFTPLVSSRCSYGQSVSYEVFITSLSNQDQLVGMVTDSACNDGICNTSLAITSIDLVGYNVSIRARNVFGYSSSSYYQSPLASTSTKLLNHSFSFSNCITYALCTSPYKVQGCSVKYSTDPSYPEDNPRTVGPLNSSFQLPLLTRLTVYYHEANISLDSFFTIAVRGVFKTGDFEIRLTPLNTVLIVVGSLLFFLALVPLIMDSILFFLTRRVLGKVIIGIILAGEVIFLLPAFILWIVTADIVSSQANTCDEQWQEQRNRLIIIAHALSDLAFLASIPSLIVCSWIKYSLKPILKEPIYPGAQYDYIDTHKAEERGITLRQNYAYSNPFKRKKKNAKNPDRVVGAVYEDTSKNGKHSEHDIKLKNNYAYRSNFTSGTAQGEGSSTKEVPSNNEKNKKKIYAPPMKMRDDKNTEENTYAASGASNVEGSAKVARNESKPRTKDKPHIQPRKMYAPLPVVNTKSHSNDKKKMSDNQEKIEKSSCSDGGQKQEYTYVATSTKCDKTSQVTPTIGPVVPPEKHTEGIKVKENYAYSVAKSQAKDSGEVYSDGYVGPVVPPIKHTEGITLTDNDAYKARGMMKKKIKGKKDQTADNSVLRNAYK